MIAFRHPVIARDRSKWQGWARDVEAWDRDETETINSGDRDIGLTSRDEMLIRLEIISRPRCWDWDHNLASGVMWSTVQSTTQGWLENGHETLKLETETRPGCWPYQLGQDVDTSRDHLVSQDWDVETETTTRQVVSCGQQYSWQPRDGHETLKLETETRLRFWPYQLRRDIVISRGETKMLLKYMLYWLQ